jgi:hypothetical protein
VPGLPEWITVSGAGSGSGLATITLVVAPNNFGTSRNSTISIGGISVSISQLASQQGAPSVIAVDNAASELSGPVAPGAIVVLYGSSLGVAQLTSAHVSGDGLYDAQLAGTSAQFNGIPAPIIYTSATQVAAVVPYERSARDGGVIQERNLS